jgi:uncharacterized protein
MEFEWNEAKADSNAALHGVSFKLATLAFFATDFWSIEDRRRDYGEVRFTGYGTVKGRLIFVAYTMRGDRVRVIHARKAGKSDVKRYQNRPVQN